ncbi:spore germination protein [Desulfonispora thiosulfatigenes DSM 11270]|uniref:Spore germination protein n=1 Tax=Desulfonispora thiosulfatigenes DSM 11270 TaxID=656914 RepID=A0A1W1VAZ4_DESTI|nr:LysM peptidoglycan-binding domain-containing protein [Desulfonispora thiosulfatigenes]SMB90456.1 spore germination protein [Desulfonispora thiosulfatigenes DSM 11270]
MLIHVVKKGDTLWKIAKKYRVSIERIIEINELKKPDQLVVGLALLIPEEKIIHTVRKGETLWLIVNKYGISLQTLIDANKIANPDLIYPGTKLIIPRKEKPTIEVNAYTYKLGQEAVPIVKNVGEYLTYLSPFAYLIKEDGNLQSIWDMPAIEAAYAENVVPMMSITNFTVTQLGENLAHVILASPEIIENLLTNIINIMKEKGYKGLNIDFENVLPRDREPYNNFLRRAVKRLHAENYFVSTALAPKVSSDQPGLLYEAHDYEAHGKIVDFIILMTYEWGYRLGPPQAISPLNQIKRVLDYAVSVIPREKIFFGFQIYARDWLLPHVKGQEAETFSVAEAIDRAIRYGADIQYDQLTQSPFYRYKDEQGRMHEVWFEDARSAKAKFDTVKEYNLRGISYWALGYPFPQNWVLLEDTFNIKKYL